MRSQEVIGNVTPKFEILMSQRNALHGKKIFFKSGKIHFINGNHIHGYIELYIWKVIWNVLSIIESASHQKSHAPMSDAITPHGGQF